MEKMWQQIYKKSVKVPAGTYYIGDTCFVMEEGDSTFEIGGFITDGEQVFGSLSTGGDGRYEDTKGRSYSVDAGNIGIVPMDLIDTEKLEQTHFGIVVTIENEFEFGYEPDVKIWLKDPVNTENSFEILLADEEF